MDDYVVKPVEPDDLLRIIDRWATIPEAPPGPSTARTAQIGADPKVLPLRPADDSARPPIVDPSALDALRALGDGEDFLRALADDFLSDSGKIIGRIVDAVDCCDARGVRDGAHALRSSAAHFGARRLHGVCASVRDVTEGMLMMRGDAFVADLRREFNLVRGELNRLLHPRAAVVAGE